MTLCMYLCHVFCLSHSDVATASVRNNLRLGIAKIDDKPVTSSAFANFMYDGPYDPLMPWVGFLRGKLIVQVCIKQGFYAQFRELNITLGMDPDFLRSICRTSGRRRTRWSCGGWKYQMTRERGATWYHRGQ